MSRFDKFRRNDPWDDLESYMNVRETRWRVAEAAAFLAHNPMPTHVQWEPGSWNDRGFTVAQGDGLFKHTDRTKIWSV